MKFIYHDANSRGHANHGWLDSYHTFSFANYHNPERMGFGVLRVLNDDTVSGGMGFGKHPHQDMEIVSIPLTGDLRHGDNMGNEGIISKGEVQVMSAGTGVLHSEKNANSSEEVKFLQIWVIPREKGVEPRYDQMAISDNAKQNDFQQIVSPNKDDEGAWVHQDAWFHLANFNRETVKEYVLKKKGNGVYIFVIEGKAKIDDQIIERRDGLGISETDSFTLKALENSEILLMEVPLQLPV
jgi:hypothetical protein